jgi:hypothetical protein
VVTQVCVKRAFWRALSTLERFRAPDRGKGRRLGIRAPSAAVVVAVSVTVGLNCVRSCSTTVNGGYKSRATLFDEL